MIEISVFTPTYNRGNVLHRVFDSLSGQDNKDFEWIIVDDGSNDKTHEIVTEFQKKADFKITYLFQENHGKHIAVNRGVEIAMGELFLIADSDDCFKANTISTFISEWKKIPVNERLNYKGITVRCFNAETKQEIGNFGRMCFDSNDLDSSFKYKFRYEKWNIVRTDVMREFPFPEPDERLKFFPESVIWWRMARKYKTRYLNVSLRGYYHDQNNSLVKKGNSRAAETLYLWTAYINEVFDYFWCSPKTFLKAFIGYSRDTFLSKKKLKDTIRNISGFFKKVSIYLLSPVGFLLFLKKRK